MTLVELLGAMVMISVLAIMLVAAVPSVFNAVARAKCATNLKTLGIATHLYAQDHDGYLPFANWYLPGGAAGVPNVSSGKSYWSQISPYLYGFNAAVNPSYVDQTFRCPCGKAGLAQPRGFVVAGWSNVDYAQFLPNILSASSTSVYEQKLPDSRHQESDAFLIDGENYTGYLGIQSYSFSNIVNAEAIARHQGKVNVLYYSGRVQCITNPQYTNLQPSSTVNY